MTDLKDSVANEHLIWGNIINHPLEKELKKSYIEYAMSVIVSRALILYAMYDMKMFYNTKHKKSARIVGEVLWKYHPHGDSSVYEAMVRMAQPWAMRYPLVDWQGNFGSMDGDSAAAMRYTEARLTKIAEEMAADIDQNTVDWRDNFDGSLQEPVMLSTRFPNHLCNGTMGIAVWMATNMAPHNLTEVIDASLLLLNKEWKVLTEEEVAEFQKIADEVFEEREKALALNKKEEERIALINQEAQINAVEWEEVKLVEAKLVPVPEIMEVNTKYSVSIDEIMEIIKWPDFPTGWFIFNSDAIKEVYKKWKWGIVMRGKIEIEDGKSYQKVVITEIPYMVNKWNLVAKIWELVVNKRIEWVTDIRDETSKHKIRIVIDVKKWWDPEKILIQLYKYTDLQCNFNMNNVSLVESGKQPRLLNIKDLLMEFVTFRRSVVYRRSVFKLKKAKDRLHILEWLRKAIDVIDEVIATIRHSETKQDAKSNLMWNFDFSELQAEYILLMRLQSLVWLEILKVTDEINEKLKLIEFLEWLINDPAKLDEVVAEEMEEIKRKYWDERRTILSQDMSVYNLKWSLKAFKDAADKMKEDVIAWISDDYSFKVLYQSRIQNIPDETLDLVYTHNQDNLIIITDKGELVVQRLKDFWSFSTQWKALDLKAHFSLKWKIIFAKTLLNNYEYLTLLTDKNSIKKVKKDLVLSFKKFPTVIMKLQDKEKIVKVVAVAEEDNVWIITKNGRMLLFNQADLRPMGKTAGWVKAIDLQDGDKVVNMLLYKDEPFILVHSDKAGKLLNVEDLKIRRRARKWQIVATGKEKLEGGISIVEGSIRIMFPDGDRVTLHSNDISLNEPETPLKKMVDKPIEVIYRPWEEKEENMRYKEEQKQKEKQEKVSLFDEKESDEVVDKK